MSDKELKKITQLAQRLVNITMGLLLLFSAIVGYLIVDPDLRLLQSPKVPLTNTSLKKGIENGIHIESGLIDAEGLMVVVNNCTNCHSAKLLIQNRMNAERWNATIKWMQETQNLWDLGENQDVIVNYLVTNYPPKKKGRREPLSDIEWYVLED